jgi:hypothetical protein
MTSLGLKGDWLGYQYLGTMSDGTQQFTTQGYTTNKVDV